MNDSNSVELSRPGADLGASPDLAAQRRAQRAALLPEAFSEVRLDVAALKRASNFKRWRGDGIETAEQLAEQMALFTQTEKPGAQVEDMLYELLQEFGQELTTPVQTLDVAGGRVFAVDGGAMLFVLEPVTAEMVMPLVALAPRELIAIEGAFQNSDTLKTNLDLQCRDAGIRFVCV